MSEKAALDTVVEFIACQVEVAKSENNGKIPYGFVANQVKDAKINFSNMSITRDHVNNMLRRRKKECLGAIASTIVPSKPTVVASQSESSTAALSQFESSTAAPSQSKPNSYDKVIF